ncbi:MAG: exodeoxyribonuclease VII small subunit [Pseudomonadales bacterium]
MPKKPTADADASPAAGADNGLGDIDFEAALAELEQLVDQMEAGEMTLEDSLRSFERGVKLTRHCQSALRSAELKIKQLTADNQLEDLDPDAFDDA